MTTNDFFNFIQECFSPIENVTYRKMMGEYCIYYRGKLVGELCDNRLLLKRTPSSEILLAGAPLESPYPGSKQLLFSVADPENTEKIRNVFAKMYDEL